MYELGLATWFQDSWRSLLASVAGWTQAGAIPAWCHRKMPVRFRLTNQGLVTTGVQFDSV